MDFETKLDGITFYRPLLENLKEYILLFANKHDIPHLPCSTPAFSQRGKIRSKIVHVLKEWNPHAMDGFFEMADIMTDMYTVFDKYVDEFVKKFEKNDHTYVAILKKDEIVLKNLFWKKVFTKTFHIDISNKCLVQFIQFLHRMLNNTNTMQRFVLHKNLYCVMKRSSANHTHLSLEIVSR
jgi:tRNA(Ile)-lysidine synthase TilS/MesJ